MRFRIAAAVVASLPAVIPSGMAQPAKAPFMAVEDLTPEKAVAMSAARNWARP